jgi:hypothetical protein
MGWGTRSNFHRQSKLLRSEAPTNYPRQATDIEDLVEGSMKLAAALYMTKKVYRPMSQEELDEFERYARGAVKVKIDKKRMIG